LSGWPKPCSDCDPPTYASHICWDYSCETSHPDSFKDRVSLTLFPMLASNVNPLSPPPKQLRLQISATHVQPIRNLFWDYTFSIFIYISLHLHAQEKTSI
jgi:hypothetical protein